MITTITVSDLTRMKGDRVCLAGYTDERQCVRPLFRSGGPTEAWLFVDGQLVIQPFARVELDLREHTPHRPHAEDWLVESAYRRARGILADGARQAWLAAAAFDSVAAIFEAPLRYGPGVYVREGDGERSLGTIRVQGVAIQVPRRENDRVDYRLQFQDATGASFDLAVTDLRLRNFLALGGDQLGDEPNRAATRLTARLRGSEIFLRLGLARNWDRYPDRCYLQVNGVYPFPDYLSGRSLADLLRPTLAPAPTRAGAGAEVDLFDVPI